VADSYDAIVIGAGIAGLAVAAELSARRRVLVLEKEPSHATQSTARSATSWIAGYSGAAVTPFTLASRAWFETGGDGYVDRSLLEPRGMLLVSPDPGSAGLREAVTVGSTPVDVAEAQRRFPALRDGVVAAATFDGDSQDIDANTAVEAFRAALRSHHGDLQVDAHIDALRREGPSWQVETDAATYRAELIVDAAGAWADEVAALAGVPPLGLTAYRRTACTFAAPDGLDVAHWPLLMDADEGYYVKPEAGGLMASPADETAQEPGNARARMEDVALALDRIDTMTTLAPRSIRSSWAGLRTFAPDRAPVLGPEPAVPGFVWYAGLGGFGIMTAPAAARSVVALIDTGDLPDDVLEHSGRSADVLPDRIRRGG
jgi:D-arginine dehydrogenase